MIQYANSGEVLPLEQERLVDQFQTLEEELVRLQVWPQSSISGYIADEIVLRMKELKARIDPAAWSRRSSRKPPKLFR